MAEDTGRDLSVKSIPKIFMVSGEASSDSHASLLLQELKKRITLESFGAGGKKMEEQGFIPIVKASSLSIFGLSEWWSKISEILKSYRLLKKSVIEKKPDVAILMDLPDFNLMLAKFLKKKQIPIVYYLAPQAWAWRKYRVHKMRKLLDKLLVIYPFEEDFYKQYGLNAHYVGNPIFEKVSQRTWYREKKIRMEEPELAILPGSRMSEIHFHAPILLKVIKKLKERYPKLKVVIPKASTIDEELLYNLFRFPDVLITSQPASQVVANSDVALVASGTASLEVALTLTPLCIFYKASHFTSFVLKHLVRLKRPVGLPNIILKKEVIREFLQEELNENTLYEEAIKLIEDDSYRNSQISSLKQCVQTLSHLSSPTQAVCDHVLQLLHS